jgi:cysteine-S-conjugate beta-lyase
MSGDSTHAKRGTGGGSGISFTTGNVDVSKRIVESTDLCSIAVSFGSVHSTISMPCFMSHTSIAEALRDRLARPSDLIRVSVGIEDVVDILEDLEQAIDKAYRGFGRGFYKLT